MQTSYLLHHLIFANSNKNQVALRYQKKELTYHDLARNLISFSKAIVQNEIEKQERIAIFLEKRFEFIFSCFGSACSGNIFIPINPILKKDQVLHILKDSQSSVLVTSVDRFRSIQTICKQENLAALKFIILVDLDENHADFVDIKRASKVESLKIVSWQEWTNNSVDSCQLPTEYSVRKSIDTDAVAIFYTSGSTGKPKGVVLSHRNMVFGAKNVASYLELNESDVLLAALPLSFDAGFSQLTTAFHAGASVVLLNYVLANDILKMLSQEKITGLTAVPPLWFQLCQLNWPKDKTSSLRFFANTGGKMPEKTLQQLRCLFPNAKPYLMFGLTESFRSTYLPPEQIDLRPHSIGKAIPNAEVLILRPDGSECAAHEEGELVHRGALVGLGYWNDPEKTAERYRPLLKQSHVRPEEIILPEIVVYSGDIVSKDEEGFIYYRGRKDEMIKTSGYRVSPIEVEEVIYQIDNVDEVAVFSLPHQQLEQAIIAVIKVKTELPQSQWQQKQIEIESYCKEKLPMYMVPLRFILTNEALLRNQNGKIDRKQISQQHYQKIEFL